MKYSSLLLAIASLTLSTIGFAGESTDKVSVAEQVRQIEISVHLKEYEKLFATLCQRRFERKFSGEKKLTQEEKDAQEGKDLQLQQAVDELKMRLLDYEREGRERALKKSENKASS
jgi:hypothetical protein